MFIKTKNYDKAIQKVRINVGTLVGLDTDEEAYLVLKEPPTMEMIQLKEAAEKNDMKELMQFFQDVLPKLIVEHNFYETEQKKMSNEEVSSFLFETMELAEKVITEFSQASFFTQTRRREGR